MYGSYNYAMRAFAECAAVTPHVLSPFASLVDVALRLAPMPAVMRPCVADEAEAGGGTPHAVVVGQDGASLRFGPSPRHLCAVADRGSLLQLSRPL